jgi:D-3-phosphoglycerate dehydrogenase / 2-oxoglutarate reductase
MTNYVGKVLLTDHPWPGIDIERQLCNDAGYELIDAPADASSADLARLAHDVTGILTCWGKVTREVVESSSQLRVISRLGVGLDNIDLEAARERRVTVTRVPDYCIEEVSDHTIALILNWARGITVLDRTVRSGPQTSGTYEARRVRDLSVGIWGSGRIGHRVAEKLSGLGCTVLFDDHHRDQPGDYLSLPIEEMLPQCDVVSLHIPLVASTVNIVNKDAFAQMKPSSLLVNTSRGALINVDDLADGLDKGRPAAAALDVLPDEPNIPPRLVGRDDVVITPHTAFSSTQSIIELRSRATTNLVRALQGEPVAEAVMSFDA